MTAGKKPRKRQGGGQPDRALDPRHILLGVELVFTNGNVTQAAKNVGLAPSHARRIVAANPEIRERAAERTSETAEAVVLEWKSMHEKAMRTVDKSMGSADDRVALQAAQIVIERVEGRVPQKIEAEIQDEGAEAATLLLRCVTALVLTKGLQPAQAMAWAQANPEKVEAWGRHVGALPPAST